MHYDTAIINHLVHELLVTDGARVGEDALVPVLAPLQGSVVAKLLHTLLTHVPATFFLPNTKKNKDVLPRRMESHGLAPSEYFLRPNHPAC